MIKYDMFRFYGSYYRINTADGLHNLSEYYDPRVGKWKCSHNRAVELVLEPHCRLVARNVVFKDSLCSQ